MAMTPREARFARQILVVGCALFVLSWFNVVSPLVGRLGLVFGIFGGAIARGIDASLEHKADVTDDPK